MKESRNHKLKPEKALSEALKLSLFIFKGFIILAFCFYIGSGIFVVPEGDAGIVLIGGRMASDSAGRPSVYDPGPHFTVPPPLGKVVLIPQQKVRDVETSSFLPGSGAEDRLAELRRQSKDKALVPGKDGYILCGDGAVAHAKFRARYKVGDPVDYYISFGMNGEREKNILLKLLEQAVVRNALSLRPLDTFDEDTGWLQFTAGIKKQLTPLFRKRGVDLLELSLLEAPKPKQVAAAFRRVQKAVDMRYDKEHDARSAKSVLLGHGGEDSGMAKVDSERWEVISKAEIQAADIVERAKQDYVRVNRCEKVLQKDPGFTQRMFMETLKDVLKRVDIYPLTGKTGQREFRLKLNSAGTGKRKEPSGNDSSGR